MATKLDPKTKTLLATAITKGIAYTENGGAPNVGNPSAGKTGEMKSIFQFEPSTWAADAKKYLGSANAPMTPDAETTVVMRQVGDWLDKGYDAKQIGSMWNAGQGEPDAYTGKFSDGSPSVGVNKQYGVKFNVPAYADSVDSYATQFYKKLQAGASTGNQQATTVQPNQTPQGAQGGATLASIQGMVQQAQNQTPQAPQSGGLMQQAAHQPSPVA